MRPDPGQTGVKVSSPTRIVRGSGGTNENTNGLLRQSSRRAPTRRAPDHPATVAHPLAAHAPRHGMG